MTTTIFVVLLLLFTVPAFAEHNSLDASQTRDLDIEVKVGRDHFRLGGQLFGPNGVAGAWLNGRLRPWGLSLDGRVQPDGKRAFNFKFDAEVLDWLRLGGLGGPYSPPISK
jgi:hypothetical protein